MFFCFWAHGEIGDYDVAFFLEEELAECEVDSWVCVRKALMKKVRGCLPDPPPVTMAVLPATVNFSAILDGQQS